MKPDVLLICFVFSSHLVGMNMSMEMVKSLSPAKPILSNEKIFVPLPNFELESYISQDRNIGCYVDRYQQGNKDFLVRSRGLVAYELTRPNQNLEALHKRKKILDALLDYRDRFVGLAHVFELSKDGNGLYVNHDSGKSYVSEGQNIQLFDEDWVAVDKKLISLKPGQAVLDRNDNCHFKDLSGRTHCFPAGENGRVVCDSGDIYVYKDNRLQLVKNESRDQASTLFSKSISHRPVEPSSNVAPSFKHDPEYENQVASSSHEPSSAQPQQEVDLSDRRYLDSGITTAQSSIPVALDPTYLYRKIDVDDPTSTVLLNDPQMQRMHALYLEGNKDVIEILKNELDCELHHHKSFWSYSRYLDPWRQAKMRRLSFVSRLLKHHAKQQVVAPSAQSIALADPNQSIKSFKPGHEPTPLSEGLFASHAAKLQQETVSSLEVMVQRSVAEDLKTENPTFSDLSPITSADLEWLSKRIKEEDWVEAFFERGSSAIGYAVEHPVEWVQNFALSNAQLIGKTAMLYMDAMSAPDDWYANPREVELFQEKAKQRIDEFSQAYNHMRTTVPQMTKADFARLSADLCAEVIIYKTASVGFSKGIGALGKLSGALSESEFLGSIQAQLERALAKHPELVTPEGVRFKVPQPMENPGVLEKTGGSVASSSKPFIGIKREKVLPRVQSYEQARNKALEIIGEVDIHTSEPHLGRLGTEKGKIVGRRWHDRKVVMRVDYDLAKGPHINVTDYRLGRGVEGTVVCLPFEGTEETYKALVKSLSSIDSLKQAKLIFESKGKVIDASIVSKVLDEMLKKK